MAFDTKPEVGKAADNRMPSPPYSCSCGKDARVSLITVVNKNTGQIKAGAASEFCGRDNHNNPDWVLQDWWEYMRWDSYCGDCFSGLPVPGMRKYSDEEVRYAWRWFIGELAAGSESLMTTFKRIKLTDSQKDKAIEIVNYEANRTGQSDAIPDEYKLAEVWG